MRRFSTCVQCPCKPLPNLQLSKSCVDRGIPPGPSMLRASRTRRIAISGITVHFKSADGEVPASSPPDSSVQCIGLTDQFRNLSSICRTTQQRWILPARPLPASVCTNQHQVPPKALGSTDVLFSKETFKLPVVVVVKQTDSVRFLCLTSAARLSHSAHAQQIFLH